MSKIRKNLIVDNSQKIYVVLGMHRSGTTFLAQALDNMGVEMGISKDAAKDLKCFFESKTVGQVNNEIIHKAGGYWDDPPSDRAMAKSAKGLSAKLKKLMKPTSKFWGFKDPRTPLTFQELNKFFKKEDDVYLYCCFRKPKKVVASVMRRNRLFKKKETKELVDLYNKRIIKHIEKFVGLK